MFSLRSLACAAALAAPMLLPAGSASAAQITGSSTATFTNVANCTGQENCRVNSSGGTNNQLEWGYKDPTYFFGIEISPALPGSTLTAVSRSWNQPTNANDLVLAELVWVNRATSSTLTPDSFIAQYNLQVGFTSPNVAGDQEAFNLTINNPTNNTGDNIRGFTLADLSNLSFVLNGVTVSDIKYKLDTTSAGSFGVVSGANRWYNPEDGVSRLFITADFTANAVPEPASLGLLGAGLFGIGVMRRRRKA